MSGIIGISPDMRSGVVGAWPTGHVLQVTAMTPNKTSAEDHSNTIVPSACTHGITVTSGNDILVISTVPYRMYASSAEQWMHMQFYLYHSTDNSSFAATSPGSVYQRAYSDETGSLPAAFYEDNTLTFNYLHESVSGTSHYYKIYFLGVNGENHISYNESYSTMTLTEIQS